MQAEIPIMNIRYWGFIARQIARELHEKCTPIITHDSSKISDNQLWSLNEHFFNIRFIPFRSIHFRFCCFWSRKLKCGFSPFNLKIWKFEKCERLWFSSDGSSCLKLSGPRTPPKDLSGTKWGQRCIVSKYS